ncbi:hypothetical protein OIU91_21045 [Streptomyces sp. NBC_01456]|uniref:hypothetical protein n=1 Tax=unclassified Streptomyces TaxID=2593676 RepID=UPI002E379B1B|nr:MULTISPECIES: hypothetical protein [unclassified Streptomyces]
MLLLSAAAVACFVTTLALSSAHIHHQSAACRYMAVPWTHFASAYGGLLAAVAAVLVHLLMSRAVRRGGIQPTSGRQSWVPALFVVIAGFMISLTAVAVALTHKDAAEVAANIGKPLCEGQDETCLGVAAQDGGGPVVALEAARGARVASGTRSPLRHE